MDLKTKLAFALVAASLLSMGTFGFFTYLWAQDGFLMESSRQLETIADRRVGQVEAVYALRTETLHPVESRRSSGAAGARFRPT